MQEYYERNLSEDWLDQIVVLVIPFDKLDPDYLEVDQNVQDNDGVTLEYHKTIPYSDFYKIEQNEAINPVPKHRRFNHTNPGNIIRCLNPECNRVFGFDSKVSSDEFSLLILYNPKAVLKSEYIFICAFQNGIFEILLIIEGIYNEYS